jgi:hypothetical protein
LTTSGCRGGQREARPPRADTHLNERSLCAVAGVNQHRLVPDNYQGAVPLPNVYEMYFHPAGYKGCSAKTINLLEIANNGEISLVLSKFSIHFLAEQYKTHIF